MEGGAEGPGRFPDPRIMAEPPPGEGGEVLGGVRLGEGGPGKGAGGGEHHTREMGEEGPMPSQAEHAQRPALESGLDLGGRTHGAEATGHMHCRLQGLSPVPRIQVRQAQSPVQAQATADQRLRRRGFHDVTALGS